MNDSASNSLLERALRIAEESFLAGSGPGGQNANKVATEVQLRVNVFALGLAPPVYARLKAAAGGKLTAGGDLLITAREHRTQDANRQGARAKLADLLDQAEHEPKRRARTRLNRLGKTQRLKTKKERGAIKAGRGRPSSADW